MGEFDKPKNERSAWDSPVGTRSDGTSSLDAPTGTKKYSMAAPSAGERSAKLDRTDSVRTDRGLARIIRDPKSSDAEKIAAMKYQEERKKAPGSVNGRGITNAEQNSNQDSQTADKETQAGLAAEAVRKKTIASQLEGDANAANKSPASSQVPPSGDGAAPVGVAGGPSNAPAGPSDIEDAATPSARNGGAGNGTLEEAVDIEGLNYRDVKSALAKTKRYIKEGHNSQDFRDFEEKETAQLEAIRKKDPMAARAFDKIDGHIDSANDQKAKFANDLKTWGATDPKDRKQTPDQILEYGAKLGLDENQINAAIRGDEKLDAGSAAISAQVEAKGRADKAANTPEAKAAAATANFVKDYGEYLNGDGKTATKEEKDDKYAELKGKAVEDGFVVTQEGKDRAAPAIEKARLAGEKTKKESESNLIYDGDNSYNNLLLQLDSAENTADKIESGIRKRAEDNRPLMERNDTIKTKLDEFNASAPAREASRKKDYEDHTKAIEIVNSGRNLNFEDIKRNSQDFLGKGSFFGSLALRNRKDPNVSFGNPSDTPRAENYGFDQDAFDKRDPKDPYFGQRVYKSQYGNDGAFHGDKKGPALERDDKGNLNVVIEGTIEGDKRLRSNTQASNDMKLQQREAAYRAPIEQVLGRNEFLKRFTLEDSVPT